MKKIIIIFLLTLSPYSFSSAIDNIAVTDVNGDPKAIILNVDTARKYIWYYCESQMIYRALNGGFGEEARSKTELFTEKQKEKVVKSCVVGEFKKIKGIR